MTGQGTAVWQGRGTMHLAGSLIGLFSFDIGYEIDLERARTRVAGSPDEPAQRRRAAPVHLRYETLPLRVRLGTRRVTVGEEVVDAAATALIHEFGAVTIQLQAPLGCDVTALPALTAALTGAGPLEDAARAELEVLVQRLGPAVIRPSAKAFVEDYYVLQIERLDPAMPVRDFVAAHRGILAAALRCEPVLLSDAETDEVFRTQLSYYPDDLIVTEWNVALVVDPDYQDAVDVLEYLNVQLVELRYYDALLDRKVAGVYGTIAERPAALPWRYRGYHHAVEDLAAIRVDVGTIVERVHNALKLSGDLYLAKVYSRTAERLSLRSWEESVREKLDVLQQMYDVLVQRVTTARAEALELAIIVLIVLEIVLFLVGFG